MEKNLKKTGSDRIDNDSGLPSRASSSSSCREIRGSSCGRTMETSSQGTKDGKRGSDPSCETGRSRRASESWPESVSQFSPADSIGEINDLYDSEKRLERVPSGERHRRRGSGRRVRRCESARDGSEPKVRSKVRRSISERGDEDDKPRRHRHHHHHHRQGSKKGSRSEYSLASFSDKISVGSNGKSFNRQRSLSESVALEIGLKGSEGVTPKESTRRKIVFAVVVISLAILTASVFLVAITLMLSPAVDAALRKENEETQIMLGTKTSARPMDVSNRTLLTTVSSGGHPDG